MAEENAYLVSARKYRPAKFNTVVGQKRLTTTLKNAISSGRLAQAYLFCGPRGVGKTSCARIFARTINCLSPDADGEACGQCASCRDIDNGNSFNIIELDAASNNSVDDIRVITEQVNVPPQVGRYRVFIIDEVHMLTSAAFNAFLKTLEEPPKYVVFILATTEKHKVIPTILSRCQTYDFRRITIEDMVEHLAHVASEEGMEAEPSALGVIARKADGAMRDALSIFDQVAASTSGHLTYAATIDSLNVLDHEYYFRLTDAFVRGDVAEALLIYKEIRDKGFDSLFFVNGLASHVRDLMVAANQRTVSLLELASDEAERFTSQASQLPLPWYYTALDILNGCDVSYRTSSNKQLLVELTLIRLCQLLKPATPPFDSVGRPIELRDPVAEYGKKSGADTSGGKSNPETDTPKRNDVGNVKPAVGAQPVAKERTPESLKSGVAAASAQGRPQAPAGIPGSLQSLRISGINGNTHVASTSKRDTPVTAEGFMKAWNQFIAMHPEQHILTSAMRKATPKQENEHTFVVTVDHPAAVQSFESSMRILMEFLRNSTSNDFLVVRAELDTTKDDTGTLSNKEFVGKVVAENPEFGKWLASIDAEFV